MNRDYMLVCPECYQNTLMFVGTDAEDNAGLWECMDVACNTLVKEDRPEQQDV